MPIVTMISDSLAFKICSMVFLDAFADRWIVDSKEWKNDAECGTSQGTS